MKKSIHLLLPFIMTVYTLQLFSQEPGPVLSPVLSPRIEWKSISWAPYKNDGVTEQTQDGSGDDWLFDVIEYYDNGVHVGYAACGYSTWGDFELYDEYAPCADYNVIDQINTADFWTEEQPRGIFRQTIGIYDLKGNLLDLYRYSTGEFYKIYQADNGDLIATGRAYSPVPFDDMNGSMYVNPEVGETPATYALTNFTNFDPDFCDEQSDGRNQDQPKWKYSLQQFL